MTRIKQFRTRALLSAAVLACTIAAAPALAQQKQMRAPAYPDEIPQNDAAALARAANLPVSRETAKEMVKGWTKPKAMLVATDNPEQLAWLQEVVPGVKLIPAPRGRRGAPTDWSKIPGIEDVAAGIGVNPSPALLKAAKNIKWFHAMGAGMENQLTIPAVAEGNYLLTNSPASLIPQVADNAIAMAIALMRGLDLYDKMAATKHMQQPDFGQRGMQIEGRTLLVVGLGGIGSQVAALAYGLGMKVIATRGSSRNGPPYVDQVGLANELPDLIGKADVVVMAAPLTAETEHLFDAKMFARMKKGAIFVNVGRGKQVVQADLIAALKSGQVGAAGLEVTDPEPLPDGDPLWDAPNLMLMTHAGAPAQPPEGIDTYRQKEWIIARENMRRYTTGEKMLDVVDPKRGY
jgi:phosphoglycerate dehydrogenase-like enzyme